MWWGRYDAVEDTYNTPGRVYLFGKCKGKQDGQYISACVIVQVVAGCSLFCLRVTSYGCVKDVPRCLLFEPRQYVKVP